MKWIVFKIILFLASFGFVQGFILPWVISNNSMPLWLDILLLSFILMLWLIVIDRIGSCVIKLMKENNEL